MPTWFNPIAILLTQTSDGNIRYFEYENDKFEYLSEYKSADPQRGIAFLPKRGVNMHENEVMRAFKTVNDSYIEPISFIVPRRAEVFQGDIYPPVVGTKPAMSAAEWFDGAEGFPPKIDLESIYEGEEPTEIPATSKSVSRVPSSTTILSPVKKEAEPAPAPAPATREPEPIIKELPPSSATSRGPPPSMKEQGTSIAQLASKYDDKEDSSSSAEDDSSSFEEVAKPIDRHAPKPVEKPIHPPESAAITRKLTSPISPTKLATPPVSLSKQPAPSAAAAPLSSSASAVPSSQQLSSATTATGANEEQVTLKDIKALLESQNRTISGQTEKIAALTAEVDRLKNTIRGKK